MNLGLKAYEAGLDSYECFYLYRNMTAWDVVLFYVLVFTKIPEMYVSL